jgi:hypothetical protein
MNYLDEFCIDLLKRLESSILLTPTSNHRTTLCDSRDVIQYLLRERIDARQEVIH